MRPLPVIICALAAAATPCPARGQDTTAAPRQDSVSAAVPCAGQVVSRLEIVRQPPTIISRTAPAWSRAFLRALLQYTPTHAGVVRDFLRLEEGAPCTEARRFESERILRAQPFLAGASVRALPDTGGTVRVEVTTVDEIPLLVNGKLGGGGVRLLTYGSSNVKGEGVYAAATWERGFAYRDGFGARMRHYHVLNRPYVLVLDGIRNPLGHDLTTTFGYPFFTNLQRHAWHAGAQSVSAYTGFVRAGEAPLSLEVERGRWEVGTVSRISNARIGAFGGMLLTHERMRRGADGVVIADTGLVAVDDAVLDGRYPAYDNTRLAAVLGLRLLDYRTVRGFDALAAEQDIARGVQLGGTVGRAVSWFGGSDRDVFVSADVYAGAGGGNTILRLRGELEGRNPQGTDRWEAVVASGRVAWQHKRSERRTMDVGLEFSGGWRERLPLQLTLGDRHAGLRGFRGSTIAGGRRAVMRIEERRVLGAISSYGLLGMGWFVDAGKTWEGNVPFGETSSPRASLGLSLLAAVPQQSRRLLRMDIAVPVTGGSPDRWQVRFLAANTTRTFWSDPGDVARVRAGAPASTIFGW